MPMMMGNRAAADVSMRYGFRGPCEAVVTACAAGTHSVANGARLVATGRCDVVLAGSAEAAMTEIGIAGFANMTALSTSGVSMPFDVHRDGFVMGEGGAVLVLEELGRAPGSGRTHLRRGDRRGQHGRRPPHHRPFTRGRGGRGLHGACACSTPGSSRTRSPMSTPTGPPRRPTTSRRARPS